MVITQETKRKIAMAVFVAFGLFHLPALSDVFQPLLSGEIFAGITLIQVLAGVGVYLAYEMKQGRV